LFDPVSPCHRVQRPIPDPSVSSSPPEAVLTGWRRWDVRLFRWMGAGRSPCKTMLVAKWMARWSWVPLVLLLVDMSLDSAVDRVVVFHALVTAGVVQVVSKRCSARWELPRPFAVGLCPNHLNHSLRAGFPSTHAMVMGSLFGFILPFGPLDVDIAVVGTIALVTGWARVYAGAHFPSDVVAGLGLGCALGLLVAWTT
jgi:undecaprenyl-diphosphatase